MGGRGGLGEEGDVGVRVVSCLVGRGVRKGGGKEKEKRKKRERKKERKKREERKKKKKRKRKSKKKTNLWRHKRVCWQSQSHWFDEQLDQLYPS